MFPTPDIRLPTALPATCRRLRPGESRLYRALRLDSLRRFPESFSGTYDEEAASMRLPFEAAIDAGATGQFVVGAFAGSRMIGLAGFARMERRKTSHRGAISQVYVDPDHRGRGVSGSLLRATLDAAFAISDIEQIELGVTTTNLAAIRLYRRFGFAVFGVHENYLKLGEQRWHMCLMQLTRAKWSGVGSWQSGVMSRDRSVHLRFVIPSNARNLQTSRRPSCSLICQPDQQRTSAGLRKSSPRRRACPGPDPGPGHSLRRWTLGPGLRRDDGGTLLNFLANQGCQ